MGRFIACAIVLSLVSVGTAGGQIASTAHDFSGRAWNPRGEVCLVCHFPHNTVQVANAPLWNHDTTAVADFTPYSSATLTALDVAQPAGISKLCLSCHDGTVALNAFGGNTWAGADSFMVGAALVGTDLSNDHPVSFTFNTALATADGGLNNPSTQLIPGGGAGQTIAAEWLFADELECGSCHDVHDNTVPPFLRTSNAGSALCLTCHSK